jgi:hypothetical protein
MPSNLRLSDAPRAENFTARQLHLPYLMSVMIFSRFTAKGVSRTAVLAASYCAGIFESFLSRDEVKFLAPVFTIYCISSGFTLLTLYHHPQIWSAAQVDLNVILKALSELSKNWRSAIGGTKALQSAIQAKERNGRVNFRSILGLKVSEDDPFFKHFPDYLCRLRAPYDAQIAETLDFLGASPPTSSMPQLPTPLDPQLPLADQSESSVFTFGDEPFDTGAIDLFGYDHFGSWLLNEPSIAALGGA